MAGEPVRFRVWSDYLCPWCYNASVRLHRVAAEHPGRVELEWRSFLLRPHRRSRKEGDRERFREYTGSWQRPAAEPDAGRFRAWQGEAGPPSHSVPPHVVAKAAALHSREAFERVHARLLEAYFAESRDVSDEAVLRQLWAGEGLPPADFPDLEAGPLVARTLAEHAEAVEAGVTGVPSVQLVGNDAVVTGAHPLELYRRWVERALARPELRGASARDASAGGA